MAFSVSVLVALRLCNVVHTPSSLSSPLAHSPTPSPRHPPPPPSPPLTADTPAQLTATNGCPAGQDTCPTEPGLDMVSNYMDYSDDACMRNFTLGQEARLQAVVLAYRPTLLANSLALMQQQQLRSQQQQQPKSPPTTTLSSPLTTTKSPPPPPQPKSPPPPSPSPSKASPPPKSSPPLPKQSTAVAASVIRKPPAPPAPSPPPQQPAPKVSRKGKVAMITNGTPDPTAVTQG